MAPEGIPRYLSRMVVFNRRTGILAVAWILGLGTATVAPGGYQEPAPESYRDRLPPVERTYREEQEIPRLDRLREEYGRNKELPPEYELQALLALSHFPELTEAHVRFVAKDYAFPISSIPKPLSTFRAPEDRTYLIRIDTEMEGPRDVLLLKNQPFNAQVGILGHELAHTVYYLERSFFGIFSDGVCFLIRNCRNRFERDTDVRLIHHGLGWQRYDHSSFVRDGFEKAGVESDGGGGAYMEPAELLEVMKSSGLYDVEESLEG